MTDESKEWVTIKIPDSIREKARDDPRTYGEIMQAGLGEPQRSIDVDELITLIDAANDPGDTLEVRELLEELRKTRELIEQVPDRTASQVEERFK